MEEELASWKGFLEGRQAIQEEYLPIFCGLRYQAIKVM